MRPYVESTAPPGLSGVSAITAGFGYSLAVVGQEQPTPPILTPPVLLPDGSAHVGISPVAGLTFTLLASTNLVDWTALATLKGTNSTMTISDPAAGTFSRRFYRAVIP
jgi:hypothetical protein